MPEKMPRRWFRYSLRTMFVSVTLICVWLGWELHIVRARQAALTQFKSHGGVYRIADDDTPLQILNPHVPLQHESSQTECRVPFVRRLLGDMPVSTLWRPAVYEQECAELRRLFPEADVVYCYKLSAAKE